MIFWILALLMMTVAVLCILVPLSRRGNEQAAGQKPIDVYLEQLSTLERAAAQDNADKDAVAREKAEISRRILKNARTSGSDPDGATSDAGRFPRIAASLMALVMLPGMALGTYFYTGSPGVSDEPLHARMNQNLADTSIEEMVMMAERHLAKNPDDAKGWGVLAGVYGRLNRPMDRARALQELIRLSGPTPQRLTDLGEALTVAGGDIVPLRARQLFEEALKAQPGLIQASLYLAIAEEQEGKFEEALARWTKLSTLRRDDERWQNMTSTKLRELRTQLGIAAPPAAPGPTAEQIQDAASMSRAERTDMIEGMVAGLASRLEDEPNDLPGWTRLIRSYSILGKPDEARAALEKAKLVFANQSDILAQLDQQANDLDLVPSNQGGESQ